MKEAEAAPITLAITALAHDGRGIGFLSGKGRGKAVFVRGALPGQTVSCRVVKEAPNFAEARLLRIVAGAAQAPLCPHVASCGGCPLQGMPYADQLVWKRRLLLDPLERIGGLAPALLAEVCGPTAPSPSLMHARNKLEFAFGSENGRLVCGFRSAQGHAVCDVRTCAVAPPEALAIKNCFLELIANSRLRPYDGQGGFWRFLRLRRGFAGQVRGWWVSCLTSSAGAPQRREVLAAGRALLAAMPEIMAFTHEERRGRDMLALGERRLASLNRNGEDDPGAALLELPLLGRRFKLDCANFFQVNDGASQELARAVAAMDAPGGKLIDLYCGVGAPGLLLAPDHEFTLGIEKDRRAVRLASVNAGARARGQWLAGDAARRLAAVSREKTPWQTVLADPPRAGLGLEALAHILRLGPQRLIYVSCNPATLARDAAILKDAYQLARLTPLDMFPHAAHVESASLWLKRRQGSD